ncbi:hypothetical protein [Streptomyces sp. NPDC047706]|uniref:hypothetical protein n=1 Tax=Streptomyces sp. NPDC047706 TaxID=3365486 RepID=UPI003720E31C
MCSTVISCASRRRQPAERAGGLAVTPGVAGGAGDLQHPAQQDDRVVAFSVWKNRYSSLTGRSPSRRRRSAFQDLDRLLLFLDRLLLFADLLAQPLELLTLGAGQLT